MISRRNLLKNMVLVFSSVLINNKILANNKSSNHNNRHDKTNLDNESNHNANMNNNSYKEQNIDASYFDIPINQPLNILPRIKNQSKDKNKFITLLTANESEISIIKNSNMTKFWLYNDTILPVIDVNVGDEVNITLYNKLKQETTIHWHGLPVVPSLQDGNPQDFIKTNEKRKYQFIINKNMIGTHFFHPHAHKKVSQQVAMGLAGVFIVRDENDPLKNIPEKTLVFHDLKLNKNGQIAKNSMMDIMNGREGQFALLNGQLQPQIKLNGTERWRIINANSARYLNLFFPEDKLDTYLVANDNGLLETPQKISLILITPGERIEVIITPKQNTNLSFIAKAYDRKKMGNITKEKDIKLATIFMNKGKHIGIPKNLRIIKPFEEKPIKKREIVLSEEGMNKFYIDGKSFDMNRIDINMKLGELEEWTIFNNSHMDHNFHLHGDHFLVKEFEQNNQITEPKYTMFKDTINLKPYEKIRILTKQTQKGIRMYHCHILEHENEGMMSQLLVK